MLSLLSERNLMFLNFCLCITTNTILITLILRFTKRHMITYSRMMLIFACFNVSYSAICAIIEPVLFAYDYGYVMFASSRLVSSSPFWSLLGLLLYASAYAQSLALLCFHFIYRWSLICKVRKVVDTNPYIVYTAMLIVHILTALVYSLIVTTFLLDDQSVKEALKDAFTANFQNNIDSTTILGGLYFRRNPDGGKTFLLKSWLGTAFCLLFIFSTFVVIVYCGLNIHWTLALDSAMSKKAKRIQKGIFRALLVQTLTPTIFEYIPSGLILICPMFGFPLDASIITIFFGMYSFAEPMGTIFFIKDYRNAIIKQVIFSYGYGFFMFCTSDLVMGSKLLSAIGLHIYASAYAQSLALLCFHFVYRYSLICHLKYFRDMSQREIIASMIFFYMFIACGYAGNVFIFLYDNPIVIQDFSSPIAETFEGDIREISSLGCVYFTFINGLKTLNIKSWIGMGICMSFITGSFTIIIFCGVKIFTTLQAATMSKKTKKLQMSLFKALVVQTMIPVACEYAPAGVVLLLPIFNLSVDTTFVTVSFGVYSFVEPCAMIYFVTDYRNAFLRKLCIPEKVKSNMMGEGEIPSPSFVLPKWPSMVQLPKLKPGTQIIRITSAL
ncbi:unnamed protein product, partial [Mesorhabditis belari]|uniref:Serpentine receptor class r-10 n=1 Tax=Mesorhabditis belari TaxID=2138241 RepID=A0AAF3FRU0_9BILA